MWMGGKVRGSLGIPVQDPQPSEDPSHLRTSHFPGWVLLERFFLWIFFPPLGWEALFLPQNFVYSPASRWQHSLKQSKLSRNSPLLPIYPSRHSSSSLLCFILQTDHFSLLFILQTGNFSLLFSKLIISAFFPRGEEGKIGFYREEFFQEENTAGWLQPWGEQSTESPTQWIQRVFQEEFGTTECPKQQTWAKETQIPSTEYPAEPLDVEISWFGKTGNGEYKSPPPELL